MASKRQLTANRRNARNSSGPRSAGGKKRASRNAYRHGLAAAIPLGQQFDREVDSIARKLLDGYDSTIARAYAHSAATASLEIARVRRAKVALIETIAIFGAEDPHPPLDPMVEADRGLTEHRNRNLAALDMAASDLAAPAPQPPQQLEPHEEALRRALAELVKLDRYERRAASRRARVLLCLSNFKLRETR
jgi:hypothetical protein